MAIEKEIKIVVDADEANKALDDINENLESSSESADNVTESIEKTTDAMEKQGGVGSKAFKKLKSELKGVTGGFKLLGKAIIATGLGALIAVFAALYKAAERNSKIMNAINTVMESVSIVLNKVITVLTDTWTTVSNATDGFDAMKVVIKNLMTIALTPLKLTFLAIKATVQAAQLAWEKSIFGGKDAEKIQELTADLERTKEQIKETGIKAIEAGKAVASNLGEAIGEISTFAKVATENVTKAVNDMSIAAITAQARTVVEGRNNIERLNIMLERQMLISQTNAELQRQIRDDESKSFAERIEANNELGRILNEQAEAEMALVDRKLAIAQAELEANQGNIELENELLRLENEKIDIQERITGQRSEQMVNEISLKREELAAEEEVKAKKQELRDKELLDIKKKAAEEARINKLKADGSVRIASTTASILQMISDEQSAAYKAAAVVEATISTISGAIQAYNSAQVYPAPVGPILGAVSAAAVAISGALNIQKILSTNKSSAGAGSARGISTGGSGAGSGASETSSPQFNVVSGTGTNQIAESLNQEQQPVKAYVVGSEVTSQQELDRKVVDEASL